MNKIWTKDFSVGDYWSRTDLNLLLSEPFQLVIEAIAGDGYGGDIAIDDTSFTPGCVLSNVDLVSVTTSAPSPTTPNPCAANNQFKCLENGQCIDKAKVCDFKVDCPTPGGSDEAECGTCTFDDNNGTLCGWRDYSYGSVQWGLATGSYNLGPSGDHTTGNGHYIAVPTTNFFQFASIRTGPIGPSGFECQLKFWYYMDYDDTVDNAKIAAYIRPESNNFTGFLFLTNIDEPTGAQWKQAVVNIGHRAGRFAIGITQDFPNKKKRIFIIYFFLFRT